MVRTGDWKVARTRSQECLRYTPLALAFQKVIQISHYVGGHVAEIR